MDGFKKRLKKSIRLRLSFWLSIAVFLIALLAGTFSFVSAFNEAHELQDDVLEQIAALFDQQHLPLTHLDDSGREHGSDEESRVIVQYLSGTPNHQESTNTEAPLPFPADLSDGMHTLQLGDEEYRVLVKTMANGERIAVAQETDERDEMARESALRTLMPFLILMPVLLLVIADLVRKLFQPITLLSNEIDKRSEQDLHSIETKELPIEVRPFIVAINRLLERVSQSMDEQRRFVANAAHELRSPLTALSLQAERLADAEMSEQAHERLATLRQGIERGRHLLDQLLALAKAHSTQAEPLSSISLQDIYKRVLEDLMPLADAKKIDLGVESASDARVFAREMDLITLIKNLVDNAIRYTPEEGRIDLSITASEHDVKLQVKDTGPGIPTTELERVFDPFYRVLGNQQVGSGLGLSIVKTIAERIGAKVQLSFSDEKRETGLCVSIIFTFNNTSLKQN